MFPFYDNYQHVGDMFPFYDNYMHVGDMFFFMITICISEMFPFYDNYIHIGDMCFSFMITICNENVYLQPTGTAAVAQWATAFAPQAEGWVFEIQTR